MERERTVRGVAVTRSETPNKYSADELALMRTQDVGYVNMAATVEERRAGRLRAGLHGLDAPRPPSASHVVFVDSRAGAARFSAEDYFDTPAELLGRAFNRPRRAQLEAGCGPSPPAGPARGRR